MVRRVDALLIVLMVAGAPGALMACEIACASHDRQLSGAETHSCHEVQRSRAASVVSGVHICGHESEMPEAAKTTPQVVHGPFLDAVLFTSVARIDGPLSRSDRLALFPPGSSKLLTPLRI